MAKTRNRQLASLISDSSGSISDDRFGSLIDQSIEPETLNFAVDNRQAGHGVWKWSWNPTTLPYEREKISLQQQNNVPIYKKGTYELDNYAAFNTNDSSTQTHNIYLKWIEEPGTANLVDWVSYDSVANQTFTGITDSGQKVQRLNWEVPEEITIPTLNTSTVTYNVGHSGGQYSWTGTAVGNNTNIGPLRRGNTYKFAVNASGHPFYLTTDNGTNFSAGNYVGEYTSGVTNSRTDNGTLTFVVPSDAPDTLYYQCGNHSSMRGEITIKNLEVDTNSFGLPILYFQHDQEGHVDPAPVRPVPSIQGQMCLTFDASKGKFVPQDLREYMDKTNTFAEKIREEIEARSIDESRMKTFMKTKGMIDESENFLAKMDSAKVQSIFSNTRGTVIDSDYINQRLGVTSSTDQKVQTESHTTLEQDGVLSVTTGSARWYAPRDIEITKIRPFVSAAPVGSALNLRVNKNGSSIHTLSVSAGQSNSANTITTPIEINEGDYLTVDVTSVGSTTAGSDLKLIIRYK